MHACQMLVVGAAAHVLLASTAVAQDYPVRDIRVLSGQAAGSGADSIVRFFSEMLRRQLQRTVVVENRPGVFGSLAGEVVARAAPDGHTIFISGYPAVSSNWVLFKKLSYDPVRDLAPVTTLVLQPFVLVVSPKLPVKSVAELTAHLKAKGDRASYGTNNSSGLALSELYKSAAGLAAVQVPYRASPDVLRDIINGDIDFAFMDSGFAVEQIRGGVIRGLAVSSAEKSSALPDLPTMAQAGVPGAQLASWFAVFLPAGAPTSIVNTLSVRFNDSLKSEEAKRFASALGAELFPGTPESLAALQKEEIARWRHIMKVAKIEPQ